MELLSMAGELEAVERIRDAARVFVKVLQQEYAAVKRLADANWEGATAVLFDLDNARDSGSAASILEDTEAMLELARGQDDRHK